MPETAATLRRPLAGWAEETQLLLIRLLGLGAALGLFYALEWRFLRSALCGVVIRALPLLGHAAHPLAQESSNILLAGGRVAVAITANCTYADLILTLAPFCWRFQRSLKANLLCLAVVAAAVLPVNVARLVLAVHFALAGVRWPLAHDAPDTILHCLVIVAAVLLALRSDKIVCRRTHRRALSRGSNPGKMERTPVEPEAV
jgi:hypothetical protein